MAIGYKNQTGASVSTPASGETWTFIDSVDGKLKRKTSAGTIVDIESGAGSIDAADINNTPAGNIVATDVQAAINELDSEKAPITHVGSKGVSQHAVADGTDAGFMSPSNFTKLAGIAIGATANDTDANLRARSSHTGTQLASTISDFDTAADARVTAGILTHVGLSDPHPGYALDADVTAAQSYAIQRSNHTGTQLASTISDFTAASKAATVQDAISNGITDVAPSQNAVFDALAGKSNTGHTHTASEITDFTAAAKTATVANAIVDSVTDVAPSQNAVFDALALKANLSGGTFTGPVVVEGDLNGTGNVNLKSQNTDPSTPASGVAAFADANEMFAIKGQSGFKAVLNDQNLTSDRQFDLPDNDGPLMADPMTAAGSMIRRNALNQNVDLPVGAEDEILRVVSGLPEWVEENLSQDIGGGGDGNVTLSGSFTASDILYYNELTIGAGTVFNPDAYIIYAKKLDLTNAPANSITRNGNNGVNSSNNTGAAGGGAFTARVLGTNAAGGTGATGQANNGVQGGAGGVVAIGNGGSGGSSGQSGAGGTGIAANAIAGGAVTTTTHLGRFEYQFIRGATQIFGGAGGRGGNSGGGDGANSSRGGGGGGAGGAVLVLICGEIVTGPSTPSGVICACGGLGGSQLSAPASGNVGGAGGAGGGGGGYIHISYVKKTGPVVSNLIDASGGNGGNGSNGIGTGIGGNGGQGGAGGRIQLFNITDGVGTLTVGAAGSNGTAGSGVTGGVGGQGGACRVSL